MKFFRILFPAVLLICLAAICIQSLEAQTRKKPASKKGKTVEVYAVGSGSGSGSSVTEPYLGLEPCAKETETQIAELENSPDVGAQLNSLIRRAGEKDEWTRACAVYRLGEFGKAAQDALPLIIKLLRDEENNSVWGHAEDALWKIPPDNSLKLEQRIKLANDPDVYRRLYAVYTLGFLRPVPHSFQAKDALKALIEATGDEDGTVRWLAVMGIREFGFYNEDTSSSIPALSELVQKQKINPIHGVRAFVPMGERALPAAPLLFAILFEPKKYVIGTDENNVQSSILYTTAAIALGRIGPALIPLLENEAGKKPFEVIQVLSNLPHDRSLSLRLKLAENPDPEVRKKAVSSLLGLTSIGAMQAMPILVRLIDDTDEKVSDAAIGRVHTIGQFTSDKSPELRALIRDTVVPKLIARLKSKNNCSALLALGGLGDDAAAAIKSVAELSRRGNYCADTALYSYGPAGRKYLSQEKLAEQEEKHKPGGLYDPTFPGTKKAKPIKPKVEKPVKKTTPNDG